MEWCRQYANWRDDQRLQAAEDDGQAGWLFMASTMYCTAAESQGFIPDSQIRRFGVSDAEVKIKALLREGLWIDDRIAGGCWLDPAIWCEERNLSDGAEKKRKADRDRQRLKRAAAKADAEKSRDSRATGSATVGDVSATPSATGRGDASGNPGYPHAADRSFPSPSGNGAGGGGVGSEDVARQSGDMSRDSRAYKREEENFKEPPLTPPQAGGQRSRCERHSRPRAGCAECAKPPLLPVPAHCGNCSPDRRIVDEANDGIDLGPCPVCHPSVVRTA